MNKTGFLAATVFIIMILCLSTFTVSLPKVNAASNGGSAPGWIKFGSDLDNTFSYSSPAQWSGSPSVSFTILWGKSNPASFALTGDLLGNGQLEVVVSSSPNLNVYDGSGNLAWSANAVRDSSLSGAVLGGITLANMNGATVVLATVSTGHKTAMDLQPSSFTQERVHCLRTFKDPMHGRSIKFAWQILTETEITKL